jgi:ADP-heptose:LPS heptosyltransferase
VKILVISLAGIGDTLMATPFLRELRANFPAATIEVLVMWAGARDLLENNPHLNRVHHKNLIKCSQWETFRYLRSLHAAGYDISVNTHPQSRIHYRIAARLVGARVRVSHDYECSGWLDRLLVTKSLPQDYSLHAAENNFALLPLIGAQQKLSDHHLEIFLQPEEEQWAADYLAQNGLPGRRWLGVHVGSGGTKNLALRRWPVERFIELAQRLQAEHDGLPVLFFGGPEEAAGHEIIRQRFPGGYFPPTRNLRQAAALLRHAGAFLSVDTALMHLAAAMRVPGQVVIETPTWNRPIQPFGNPFTLVPNPVVNGRGLEYYRYDGGDIKGTAEELTTCMASVTVEAVLAAVTRGW